MRRPAEPRYPQRSPESIRLDRGASDRRRRRERRIWLLGLLGSVTLHVLVLGLLWDRSMAEPRARRGPAEPMLLVPPPGIRAVEIRVAAGEEPDDETSPTAPPAAPVRPAGDAGPVDDPDVVAAAGRARPADDRDAADRLAPRLVDPRLWRPVIILPTEPTLEEVEARVGAALELLSDSALAEAERRASAVDWTIQDADGGRWGISPGKLHLGKLTLPLPIAFPPSAELDAKMREWHEFQAWSERAAILETFEDRVRAIRERRERERSESRTAGNGGGGGGGGG